MIQAGRYLGAFPTIMIVLITGVIGSLLARSQGLSIYSQIRMDLQNGIIPTDRLIDGLFILIAGVLLITPGMITDIFGFFLMVPEFRGWLKGKLKDSFKRKLESGQFQFHSDYRSADWRNDDDF